jgi:hypothetical protein
MEKMTKEDRSKKYVEIVLTGILGPVVILMFIVSIPFYLLGCLLNKLIFGEWER